MARAIHASRHFENRGMKPHRVLDSQGLIYSLYIAANPRRAVPFWLSANLLIGRMIRGVLK